MAPVDSRATTPGTRPARRARSSASQVSVVSQSSSACQRAVPRGDRVPPSPRPARAPNPRGDARRQSTGSSSGCSRSRPARSARARSPAPPPPNGWRRRPRRRPRGGGPARRPGRGDADAHAVLAGAQDPHLDAVADDDGLVAPAGEDEHGLGAVQQVIGRVVGVGGHHLQAEHPARVDDDRGPEVDARRPSSSTCTIASHSSGSPPVRPRRWRSPAPSGVS